MNIQTILVPVDFSSCSLLLAKQAAGLAARLGARVVLLHVAELPAGISPETHIRPGGAEMSASEYLLTDVRARLDRFAQSALSLGVPVEIAAEVGPVVPTILAQIDHRKADMVIIGTHGRTGLARMVLGSVAEAVAHRAHVPVMLVRREARPECGRSSCEWCGEAGLGSAEEQISAENQG